MLSETHSFVYTVKRFQVLLCDTNNSISVIFWHIGLMSRVVANGPGDQGSIPGRVIPKTLKNGTWYLLA